MKLTTTTLAIFAALTAPTFAGPLFFLPDHEPNGWRDTGCDEAANVYVYGKAGNVLYLNNPTCPNAQGGMDAGHSAYVQPEAEEVAEEPGEDTPVEEAIAAK